MNTSLFSPRAPGSPQSEGASLWRQRLGRCAWWMVGAAALALVFMAYANPLLAVEVAELMWSCF